MTTVHWNENGTEHTADWRSESGAPAPRTLTVVADDLTAAAALRLARSGTGLLWRGDFHNARQLMRAMDRRIQKRVPRTPEGASAAQIFRANRRARAQRADLLGKILIELEPDHTIRLRRAPEVREACALAYGRPDGPDGPDGLDAPGWPDGPDGPDGLSRPEGPGEGVPGESAQTPAAGSAEAPHGGSTLVSLPEILGVISAYEWHRKGIEIAAVGGRIHSSYGVFAPTRHEYIDLVAEVPLPQAVDHPVAIDVGTGTGVLAVLLAQRGAQTVVATDINPRAVQCARENVDRLGVSARIRVEEADLWPAEPARADLVVCNPPWLPGEPTSDLERGIYDPESDVLHRFLRELPDSLTQGGEGWLILSDLAELLGLRTRDELLERIAEAGLTVRGTHETAPRHPRASDSTDPLHAARSRERTLLWRLGVGDG